MKKVSLIFGVLSLWATSALAQATDTQPVTCDGSVTITATPKAGYHFVQWNDGNTDATRTITNIKEAKTFTATFAADETAIDPSINPGVTLPVAHGTVLHLTPQTDDDCKEFEHWSDINDPTDPNYNIVPRDFVYNGILPTFTAVFKTKVFNVTVNADDGTHGTVTLTVL